MNTWHDISMLAESDSWLEIIFFLVVALFWVIGAVVKKLQERKVVENERRLARQGRDAEDTDGDLFESSSSEDDGWQAVPPSRKETRPQPQPQASDGTPPPLPGQARSKPKPISQFVRSARKSLAEQLAPEPAGESEELVELQQVQQRQDDLREKQKQLQRQRRLVEERTRQLKRQTAEHRQAQQQAQLAARQTQPAYPATTSLDAHARSSTSPRQARYRIALDDPRTARAAVIFHEILAPPKALREDRELWDA